MTRIEEKLYFQSVFDAIDEVYKMKNSCDISSYEERLRISFNKLLIPDWYNDEYKTKNGLRKTKSHGHVPRTKRIHNHINNNMNNNNNNNNNNNIYDDTPDTSISSSTNSPHLSNGKSHQSNHHRSPTRSWSEKPPLRHNSTTSSCDTNTNIINGRRSAIVNGSITYAPGVQRVAQSSTWYKPRTFIANEPPKPLPRYSKLDPERLHTFDTSSSTSKIKNDQCPIKPRTMAQIKISSEEILNDVSNDNDVTLIPQSPISNTFQIPGNGHQTTTTDIFRSNSIRSISSEAESNNSNVNVLSSEKNLVATDSSSYASVNDRCLSPSTASYHTALAGDSSSMTGYETPTPQMHDDNTTLSSHSSLSDLSHAETLEPNAEDLDNIVINTTEQKPVIIPSSVDITMENLQVDRSVTKSSEIINRPNAPMETSIPQTTTNGNQLSEIREISNDGILREIDINAVGDEFFVFSPGDTPDAQVKNTQDYTEHLENSIQQSKRIFTMDDNEFHYPLTINSFNFDSNNDNHNTSSLMITNLDDIIPDSDRSIDNYSNGNYRRPIQEDVLYEVDHENSLSEISQHTSSIIPDDAKPIKTYDVNTDCLTSLNNIQTTETETTAINNDNTVLPIYISSPSYTTSVLVEPPSSLHIDTTNNYDRWNSIADSYSYLTSQLAYTSKIRHRHYSVGSYYDHKTTKKLAHSNNTFYFLGSAPVSPLSRGSTPNSDTYYHIHPQSPIVTINALKRVNPFLNTNIYSPSVSNYNYERIGDYHSTSIKREEHIPTDIKLTRETIEHDDIKMNPIVPQPIASPPSTRTTTIPFTQFEKPSVHPKFNKQIPVLSPPPVPPPRFSLYDKVSSNSIRKETIQVQEQIHNIYQDIDSALTEEDQTETSNADLQFIRGTIERVFHFNNDSTSETNSFYEDYQDSSRQKQPPQPIKTSSQYPAIEAFQRFYTHQPTNVRQITNLDDVQLISQNNKNPYDRTISDEIDDTFNDIEDVDDYDEKQKRQIYSNYSCYTSNENSPINSLNIQAKTDKASQETQTLKQQNHQTNRTIIPPIEIVTDMVIEQEEMQNIPNGHVEETSSEMVIYYDDIEIVENTISSCSSESESNSLSQQHYSKPNNAHAQVPPPVPERTLKPTHLFRTNNQQQTSKSISNNAYDFEKSQIRKKFDINTVNDMFNRTERNMNSSATHRHPSARHFVGKLNHDDILTKRAPEPLVVSENDRKIFSTLPTRSVSSSGTQKTEKNRSLIADTNALVKQIQKSLSRNSLHDTLTNSTNLSASNKDLRSFVSPSYSPNDDCSHVQMRNHTNSHDEQIFKRQARLSKSFQNVSEYNSTDQRPKTLDQQLTLKSSPQPAKSIENHLNQTKQTTHLPINLTSVVKSTSISALTNSDDNARMLSMKWYTGQVSENSEICYLGQHTHTIDLLHGYISKYGNQEIQTIFERLQKSNDPRVHAALDDISTRVSQFDSSKTPDDIHVFMRYIESRLRDINNKKIITNENQQPSQLDDLSVKSQLSSASINNRKENPPTSSRQLGRQHFRSIGSNHENGNGHFRTPPRRSSQSSNSQENSAAFDDMLNTVLALPKKGVSALSQTNPLNLTQPTKSNKSGNDIGKRLFESGTHKDPRLIYDGPKRDEKEEQPLETSV